MADSRFAYSNLARIISHDSFMAICGCNASICGLLVELDIYNGYLLDDRFHMVVIPILQSFGMEGMEGIMVSW